MIDVRAEKDRVEVSIPTEGMSLEEVDDFVSRLRVESVVQRSRLMEEDAWKLSEEIKAGWWEANKARFEPKATQ